MVVLDTHAALWWSLEPKRLGRRARSAIAAADRIGVPTIVFWEAALLVRKHKLALDVSVAEWVGQLLAIPRVDALPLTAEVAWRADGLAMHADPADRFIVATAMAAAATLVTKDRPLRALKFVQTVW